MIKTKEDKVIVNLYSDKKYLHHRVYHPAIWKSLSNHEAAAVMKNDMITLGRYLGTGTNLGASGRFNISDSPPKFD